MVASCGGATRSWQFCCKAARYCCDGRDRRCPDPQHAPRRRPSRQRVGRGSDERPHMAAKALFFDVGDYVVYPKHGVGRVIELQKQEIAGTSLELYVLRFEKERMTLRVPTNKAESVGMRKLSSDKTMREAMDTLKGKPKVKRTMWSRRAQEYEAKINSGDLVSIAEVVRDLFRADDQPEQSYSERQIFEAATSRLARELAAMEELDEPKAQEKILEILRAAAAIYNKDKPAA
ncbi:CarD family transcriptional regulator [Microvirga sp. SRT01]|nr:CarD family transcriptional regulator [Microvirga sp. SRT01]